MRGAESAMEKPNDPFISAFGVDYAAHFGDPLKAIEGALRGVTQGGA